MSAFRWDDDPETAGTPDPRWRVSYEAMYCRDVVFGHRRYSQLESKFTDERFHLVALLAEGMRDRGLYPTPERVVRAFELGGAPTRGALAWMRRLWLEHVVEELRRDGVLAEEGIEG